MYSDKTVLSSRTQQKKKEKGCRKAILHITSEAQYGAERLEDSEIR